MWIWIHVCVCTYIYIYVCVRMSVYVASMQPYEHTHTHTHTHTHSFEPHTTHTHNHTHTTLTTLNTPLNTPARVRSRTHTHTYTHTRTYTHTYTPLRMFPRHPSLCPAWWVAPLWRSFGSWTPRCQGETLWWSWCTRSRSTGNSRGHDWGERTCSPSDGWISTEDLSLSLSSLTSNKPPIVPTLHAPTLYIIYFHTHTQASIHIQLSIIYVNI